MINEYCAKKFCCEDISLIENYALAIADTTQTWDCHHRGEILPCGRYEVKDLKKFGLYYNRPANELIFLPHDEHISLHYKGVPLSEEHKKAISDAHKGVPLSEATKKAISDAMTGVPKSEEHKKAISDGNKGVPRSEATKKAIGEGHSKKILQYTKSGEFVREWPSATEAQIKLGIAQSNICKCCKGKLKSAGGYVWSYADEYENSAKNEAAKEVSNYLANE